MSKRNKDNLDSKGNGADTGAPATDSSRTDAGEGQAGESASERPGFASELEALKAQLAEKDREIAELNDKYLRSLAEAENSRKRIRRQSEESVRLERENLLRDLLPIVDNLERAVGAARGAGNGKSIAEGVEMVLGALLDFLRAQGVTAVDAVGQPFDPRVHEAVEHVDSEDQEPNTVIAEFHRGYTAGERVLRPARVSVARRTAGEHDEAEPPEAKGEGEE